VKALQVEINRALYRDEARLRRTAGSEAGARAMPGVIAALAALPADRLAPLPMAAQ